LFFFFFQAEDGIRDGHVTGVQTCALPILLGITRERVRLFLDLADALARDAQQRADLFEGHRLLALEAEVEPQDLGLAVLERRQRSEERRVGKESAAQSGRVGARKRRWYLV